MSKTYDQQTDFTSAADSNQNVAASIQPVTGGEHLWEAVLNRTPENLRARTEVLRKAVDDLRYYADYDRVLLTRAAENTTFTFAAQMDGSVLTMTGGPLWIYPALTPGRDSGGRAGGARMFVQNGTDWVDFAGTDGVNDLSFTAGVASTGMRGYADTDSFAAGPGNDGFSLGGNRLRISLVANPSSPQGTVTATVTGSPVTLITITYGTSGGSTTIQQIINWVNADITSQSGYGLSNLIFASSHAASPTTATPPPITNAVFQGGHDAEAHQITSALLGDFFNANDGGTYRNRLLEGEGLAVSFEPGPVERSSTGAAGGRRQAIFDLPTARNGSPTPPDNTPSRNLFNTGREPHKIPGSVPIGKMLEGKFVFIDGTIVGATPISLSESHVTLSRLASQTNPTTGATLIGYGGSGQWAGGPGVNPHPTLPPSTVEVAIDNIVADLALTTNTGSGALRVGSDEHFGLASEGNRKLNVSAGTLSSQIEQIVNTAATATTAGGVNARVSEYGHRMQGFNPIEKVFSATTPINTTGGGAQLIRAVLNPPTNAASVAQIEEQAAIYLQPYLYDAGTDNTLAATETVEFHSGAIVKINDMNATRAENLRDNIVPNLESSYISPHCVVYLSGVTPGSGYYFVGAFNPASRRLTLMELDGGTPDFSVAVFSSATVSFFRTRIVGNSQAGARVRSMVPGVAATADTEYFGDGSIHAAFASNGARRHTLSAAKAQWGIDGVTRDTDNILVTADKTLLDGVETGTVVDATASHHHGDAYSGTIFYPLGPEPLTLPAEWSGSLGDVATNTTLTVDSVSTMDDPNYIPQGYTKTAAIIHATISGSTGNYAGTLSRVRINVLGNGLAPSASLCYQQRQGATAMNATGAIVFGMTGGVQIHNKYFTISDGVASETFRFWHVATGGSYGGPDTPILFQIGWTQQQLASATQAAIHLVSTGGSPGFQIVALVTYDTVNLVNATAVVSDTQNVAIVRDPTLQVSRVRTSGMSGAMAREDFYYTQQFIVPVTNHTSPVTSWQFVLSMVENTNNFSSGMTLDLREVGAVVNRGPRP